MKPSGSGSFCLTVAYLAAKLSEVSIFYPQTLPVRRAKSQSQEAAQHSEAKSLQTPLPLSDSSKEI